MTRILSLLFSLVSFWASAQVTAVPLGTASAPTASTTVTTPGQYADATAIKRSFDTTAALRSTANSNSAKIAVLQSNSANAGSGSPYSRHVQTMRGIGSTIQYEAVSGTYFQATTTSLGMGTGINLIPLETMPANATLNGAVVFVTNTPAYTTTSGETLALYSYNSGTATYTLEGQTAANTALFKPASPNFVSAAFQTAVVTKANVQYFIAPIHNQDSQTTAPQLLGFTVLNGTNEVRNRLPGSTTYNAGFKFGTSPPASITFSQLDGSSTFRPWIAVY